MLNLLEVLAVGVASAAVELLLLLSSKAAVVFRVLHLQFPTQTRAVVESGHHWCEKHPVVIHSPQRAGGRILLPAILHILQKFLLLRRRHPQRNLLLVLLKFLHLRDLLSWLE